jgi:hypothetical protein
MREAMQGNATAKHTVLPAGKTAAKMKISAGRRAGFRQKNCSKVDSLKTTQCFPTCIGKHVGRWRSMSNDSPAHANGRLRAQQDTLV